MMLAFGPWEPDKFLLDATVIGEARNVYAGASSYLPMPQYVTFGSATLAGDVRGLAFARDESGGWLIFSGETDKLYKYSGGAWVDYTRTVGGAYAVPSGDWWHFTQFGSLLIATNSIDDPQVLDVDGAATAFSALGGSPPKARVAKAIGDFVFLCGIATAPKTLKWSGINDVTEWTKGTNLSDEQEFPTGGRIMNIWGGKTGFVLLEQAVHRFAFLPGSDYAFEFAEVEGAKGCMGPYCSAAVGSTVFYLGEDGFYAIGGGGLNPIGAQRVNEWFKDNSDSSRVESVVAVADPYNPRIVWNFYSSSTSTAFDRQIIYDWQLDRWTYAIVSQQIGAAIASPGLTLEELDTYGTLETLPASLDARLWQGGLPTMGYIGTGGEMAFQSGAPMEAIIETVEAHLAPGQRAFARAAYPMCDASSATLAAGTRERLQDTRTWGSAVTLERTGRFSLRSSARLHRFRFTVPASATWTHASGVDVDAVADGDA